MTGRPATTGAGRALAAGALLAWLLVGACSGGDDAAVPTTTTAAPTTVPTTAPVVAPPVAPLTGLPDPSGAAAGRPALAVKIDNAPAARPQAGLEQADVVFEEVVEGGSTRFIAVYQSTDAGAVGPVRSVRPMDPQILAPLHGLLGYSGGIPEFIALLQRSPVQDVGFDRFPDAYHQEPGRRRPHSLFATLAKLWSRAQGASASPPPALFLFRAPGEQGPGDPAASLSIAYSRRVSAGYDYDAASASWLRSTDGAPHAAAAGPRLSATNLVVQFVPVRLLSQVDAAGTRVSETVVVGGGEAWLLSGATVVKGRWERPAEDQPTRYLGPTGEPVELAPGRTWIHLVPQGSSVTVR